MWFRGHRRACRSRTQRPLLEAPEPPPVPPGTRDVLAPEFAPMPAPVPPDEAFVEPELEVGLTAPWRFGMVPFSPMVPEERSGGLEAAPFTSGDWSLPSPTPVPAAHAPEIPGPDADRIAATATESNVFMREVLSLSRKPREFGPQPSECWSNPRRGGSVQPYISFRADQVIHSHRMNAGLNMR